MSTPDQKHKEISAELEASRGTKRNKHLVFSLKDEKYGIPLSVVKEVIGMTEITPIPHVPVYFKGLINLRGKIISVIDLRVKLEVGKAEISPKKTCIIITEINDLIIGVIVDEVEEVAGFEPSQMEHNLDIQSKVSKDFITGVAKISDRRLILLLDISKTLSLEELNILKNHSSSEA
ncbi:MAG: chemotaxis protein CheW [Bacteriovoracia bacterium]